MPDYETSFGDTENGLQATLKRDNVAIDISTATVVVRLEFRDTKSRQDIALTKPGGAGIVQRDWGLGFPTAGAGDYDGQYIITFADGDVEFVPNNVTWLHFRFNPVIQAP